MSKIPRITGHTNHGTIMKNRKPSIQMTNFSLSQFNARSITRRQVKRIDTSKNESLLGKQPEQSSRGFTTRRSRGETPRKFSF